MNSPLAAPLRARRYARTLLLVSGFLLCAAAVATAYSGTASPERIVTLIAFAEFIVVGGILTIRVPENGVSWTALACGGIGALWSTGDALRDLGLAIGGPIGTTGFFAFMLGFAVFLPAIFPTGRPIGRMWGWSTRVGVVAWAIIGIGRILVWFAPGPGTEPINDATEVVGILGLLVAAAVAITSLVVRWVRSSGVERLQLDWLAGSFILTGVGLIDEFLVPGESPVGSVALSLGVLAVPIAIALAITRYRLYDVGRVISRTVAYLILAILVATGYGIGAVWLPTRLGTNNPLFVAGTTLAILTALNPIRRWLVRRLDRRFNRTPYDPDAVIDGLTAQLRSTTVAADIRNAWATSVQDSLAPATISLWTRL